MSPRKKPAPRVPAPFDRTKRDELHPRVVQLVQHRGENRWARRHVRGLEPSRPDKVSAIPRAGRRPGTNDTLYLDVDAGGRHTGTYTMVALGLDERPGTRPARRTVRSRAMRSAYGRSAARRAGVL